MGLLGLRDLYLMNPFENAERVLLTAGLLLLGFCAVAYVGGRTHARVAVNTFKSDVVHLDGAVSDRDGLSRLDKALWSDKRIRDYEASSAKHFASPIALLQIPRLRLEVPVFDGTDDLTLNRGVGRIIGTARPDEDGNIAIAGHRDGFFRVLKDIAPTDTLQLVTKSGVHTYLVDYLRIVSPEDVSVLRTTESPSVTLVTCYPFYLIGSAPKRFIIHASWQPTERDAARHSVQVSSKAKKVKAQENRK